MFPKTPHPLTPVYKWWLTLACWRLCVAIPLVAQPGHTQSFSTSLIPWRPLGCSLLCLGPIRQFLLTFVSLPVQSLVHISSHSLTKAFPLTTISSFSCPWATKQCWRKPHNAADGYLFTRRLPWPCAAVARSQCGQLSFLLDCYQPNPLSSSNLCLLLSFLLLLLPR